jgi:hypothetical protein
MTSQLETFHSFQDEAIALEFAEVLTNSGILCRIASTPRMLDAQLIGVDSTPDYALKIRPEDFNTANNILDSFFEKQIGSVEKDYFLFSFTTEELNDVLKKPDEWGYFNYQLAKKILAEKGQNVSEEALGEMREERKKDLSATEPASIFLYIIAWFLIISDLLFLINRGFRQDDFITVFLPIFSFFIGRHINSYKKIMPDGQSVYGYHENDRIRGKFIKQVAFVVILISSIKLILLVLSEFSQSAS